MSDLSSPNMQRMFKSVQRLNISLYVVMLLIMLSGIGLGALMSTRFGNYYGGLDWAQITYIVLLSVTLAYAIIVLVLNLLTRKPYKAALRAYVAGTFGQYEEVLKGGESVEIDLYLLGDRLCIARQGCEELVYLDLSAVKKYYSVCAQVVSLSVKYLTAYYSLNGGYFRVTLVDATSGKTKIREIVSGGNPKNDCRNNPFVKYAYLPK